VTQVLRFLIFFEVTGLAGVPLAARAFGRLPGAGVGFARILAWLVLAWLIWMLGSLGIPNGTPLALICALLVIAAAVVMHRRRGEVGAPDRFRRRLFIAGEVLFVVSFLIAVLIGAYGADVNAPTEKPMDMMLLNSTLASSDIPPHDPWLSGSTLNYYYLGHHMAAVAIRLTGIEPSAGYNLALAAIFALIVTTAFTTAATLAEVARRQGLAIKRPLLAGGLCVVLLALMASWRGGWTALHPHGPWLMYGWFDPSRIIPNTINEWPFFSWTVGDLHAHFIAIPLTLLALGFIIQVGTAGPPRLRSRTGAWETFAAALAIGWLYGVNSWSWPVMAGLLVLTMLIWVTSPEATHRRRQAVAWTVGVILAGIVLLLPFLLNFDPNAKGFAFTQEAQREPFHLYIKHHLEIEGPLLWLLVAPLLAGLLGLRHRLRVIVWGLGGLAILLPVLASHQLAGAGLTLVLVVAALAAGAARKRTTAERVLWVLAATGLACIFAAEIGVVRDEFAGGQYERMNTVFKMGYQAWLLLAVFGAVALAGARAWLPLIPRLLWVGVATVLIGLSLPYVLVGTDARKQGLKDGPRLDGREWLRKTAPGDVKAIDYIRAKLPGDAVVLEAVGDDYSAFGNTRISTFTGRQTVLGWQGHELQWSHDIGTRREDVQTMYTSPDAAQVQSLIDTYGVGYAVVGPLEKTTYGGLGALGTVGTVIFTSDGTVLYKLKAGPKPVVPSPAAGAVLGG
jgi:YYY domain-containing protein